MNLIAQYMEMSIAESIRISNEREKLFNDYVKTNHFKEIKYWFDWGHEDDRLHSFKAFYNPRFKTDVIKFNIYGKIVSIDDVICSVCPERWRKRFRFRFRRSDKWNDYYEEVHTLEEVKS